MRCEEEEVVGCLKRLFKLRNLWEVLRRVEHFRANSENQRLSFPLGVSWRVSYTSSLLLQKS